MLAITGIVLVSAATVTEAPLPQNVSIGQLVNFTCATTNNHDVIAWSTNPNVIATSVVIQSLPDGGKLSVLSFTALLEHNNTIVRCIVVSQITTINTALLLVQGESIYIQIYLSIYTLYRSPVTC